MQQQQHYQAEVQPGAAEHAADHVHVVLVPYGDVGRLPVLEWLLVALFMNMLMWRSKTMKFTRVTQFETELKFS